MNRLTLVIGIVALAIGALGGWLGSGLRSDQAPRPISNAHASPLERQIGDLRTENDRMGAQLKNAQAQLATTEADLRREKEMNARLHILVSDGRK
jgi:hypothetical protein